MEIQKIEIIKAINILKNKGIVATSSESSYGLSCMPDAIEAIKNIFLLKKRQYNKGLILIGYRWEIFENIVDLTNIPQKNLEQMLQSWTAPATWIVPLKPNALNIFPVNISSVAIRVTKHSILYQLSKTLNSALISTSANVSGLPPATTKQEVETYFANKIDFIISSEKPSTGSPTPIFDLISLRQIR